MVDTCHVTGVVISPDGDPVPRATVRFQRLPHEVFVEDDRTGIPREVRAEADADGNIAVDLIPGEYKVLIIARGYNQYPAFNVGVPDQPTAVLADIQDVPPPPSLDDATRAVRDAREARDESREARDEAATSAQAAADAAQGVEDHATAAANSAQAAADSEQAAGTSAGSAATSASNAAASATAAGNSASAAATSEQNAADSASAAAGSASAASTSASNAADAQQAAQTAAQTAQGVADALPDPDGQPVGMVPETDGLGSYASVINGIHHYKGEWFGEGAASYSQGDMAGGSGVVGRGSLVPVFRTVVVDALCIEVTSAGEAGAIARFILYQMEVDSFTAATASLLYDGTGEEVAVDSEGIKELVLNDPVTIRPPGVFAMIQRRDDYDPVPQIRRQASVRGYTQGAPHGRGAGRLDRPSGVHLQDGRTRFDGFSDPSPLIHLTLSNASEGHMVLLRVKA